MSSRKEYLDKVLNSEGQEKFDAAKKLVEGRDISSTGVGLIRDLKFGEKLFKESLKKQKNIYYERNTNEKSTNSKSHSKTKKTKTSINSRNNNIKELKNPPTIEESNINSTSRSKYLWSSKSATAYDRMCITLNTKSDVDIGSDFEFLLGLHDTLQSHVNIGVSDTIFSMPSTHIPAVSDTDGAGVSYVSSIIRKQQRQERREQRQTCGTNEDSESESESESDTDTDTDDNGCEYSNQTSKTTSTPTSAASTHTSTPGPIEMECSTDMSLLRIFSNFKYSENCNSVCKDEFLKSAIENEVYTLINDFQYCVNNGDYNIQDIMKSGAEPGYRPTNAGEFPVKAILRALPQCHQDDNSSKSNTESNTESESKPGIYIRPLCTAGDVLLAMHELLDRKLFKCGSISLPHAVRGPFVRDPTGGTFFRCVFRLNQKIHIYHMK